MKLKTKTIGIVAVLMAVSLVGLIFLQYTLLRDAIELKEQAFRQNVNAAMNAITQKLETRETIANMFRYHDMGTVSSMTARVTVNMESGFLQRKRGTHQALPKAIQVYSSAPLQFEGNMLHYTVLNPEHVTLRIFNTIGKLDTILVDSFQQAGAYSIPIDRSRFPGGEFFCKFGGDSNALVMKVDYKDDNAVFTSTVSRDQRRVLVGKVLDNLVTSEQEPIEQRLDPNILDSVVTTSLKESGIAIPCTYGVLNERSNVLRIVKPAGMEQELRSAGFHTPLFPLDFLADRNQLLLFFPDQRLYLLKEIGPLLALIILFMSVIIYCFTATMRMIVRQKQFSGRLVDFINNMTHEFKTPVSTIAVAAETMMRPDVIRHEEKLLRYGTVIQDENLRMKHHIDRILQMAVLEEGEFELKLEPVDVHKILNKAIEPLRLRIEARQGAIHCNCNAPAHIVMADPVHLTNVFHNLLDNAEKYSPECPEISIATLNTGNTITIRIGDTGIGIGKDELRRVFEKYYRVPTGNIHNVKGFGLGLSYVKLMADAHGARVGIESEPGEGTIVSLTFPLAKDAETKA